MKNSGMGKPGLDWSYFQEVDLDLTWLFKSWLLVIWKGGPYQTSLDSPSPPPGQRFRFSEKDWILDIVFYSSMVWILMINARTHQNLNSCFESACQNGSSEAPFLSAEQTPFRKKRTLFAKRSHFSKRLLRGSTFFLSESWEDDMMKTWSEHRCLTESLMNDMSFR